jgi:hypothetical protein
MWFVPLVIEVRLLAFGELSYSLRSSIGGAGEREPANLCVVCGARCV